MLTVYFEVSPIDNILQSNLLNLSNGDSLPKSEVELFLHIKLLFFPIADTEFTGWMLLKLFFLFLIC